LVESLEPQMRQMVLGLGQLSKARWALGYGGRAILTCLRTGNHARRSLMNLRTMFVLSIGLVCMVILFSTPLKADSFSDNFGGSSINPFWNVVQQFGTVTLSTDESVTSGGQSAKFTSSSGGQRDMELNHTFSTLMTGTTSVWFYDAAPGQETLYESLQLSNTQNGDGIAVGTQDFDPSCYKAFVLSGGITEGPGANCGSSPDIETTDVTRTLGWHLLTLDAGTVSTTISIDGTQVFATPGSVPFNMVSLIVSGPSFRPDTVAYFDDFSINTTAISTPEPDSVLLLGTGLLVLVGMGWRRNSQTTSGPVLS